MYTSLSRAKALQHCGWSSRSRYLNNIDLDMNAVDLNSSSQSPSSQSSLSALFDGNMPCDTFVESNEEEVNYTRSAAVMVFNGKIQQAIKCLQKASNYLFDRPNDLEDGESITLNVIALALSSYEASANPKEEDSMWKKTCKNLKNKLRDPYIKAIFIFLSMNGQDEVAYNEIIVSRFAYFRPSFVYNFLFFCRIMSISIWTLPIKLLLLVCFFLMTM